LGGFGREYSKGLADDLRRKAKHREGGGVEIVGGDSSTRKMREKSNNQKLQTSIKPRHSRDMQGMKKE